MINCSLSPKPQRMCADPCLLPLNLCLSASTPLWHTDACTSFRSNTLHCSPHIQYTVAHTLDQIYTEIHWAIFVFSLRCFFACVISPYISRLEAGGVITSDTVHSREAVGFCLCVTARLDADQGRILANLWDLTRRLFRVLCFPFLEKSFEEKAGHSDWIGTGTWLMKIKARVCDL